MTSMSFRVTFNLLSRRVGLFRGQQIAGISSKTKLTEEEKLEISKIKPWPYREKGYRVHHSWYENTSKRFHENSKLISIEGPPCSGKHELGRALADELMMKFFPMSNMDSLYINPYGYDLRDYNHLIEGHDAKCFDEKDFIKNPHDPNVARMQVYLYKVRIQDYMDALAHIFNTGQGAVTVKNMYTDRCFSEAMYKTGYISKHAYVEGIQYYYDMTDTENINNIKDINRPHLVIYLDVPPEKTIEALKKRGRGEEKTITLDFLRHLEKDYKENVLPKLETHSEVLIYDWSEGGDPEVVVEDIERIDFEQFSFIHDPKMKDWRYQFESYYNERRHWYTTGRWMTLEPMAAWPENCEEILINTDNAEQFMEVYHSVPGNKYAPGFNSDVGDKNVWLKMFSHPGQYNNKYIENSFL